MNTLTRMQVSGRKPAPPAHSHHHHRQIEIPGFGPVCVAWHVAAGLFVGQLVTTRGFRYIVPVKPQHFPSDGRIICYTGPRPFWFYFYVVDQEQI